MRMRRRSNASDRLAALNDCFIQTFDDDANALELVNDKAYLDFHKLFGNNNPVYLEIGCGQGYFACETAKSNPDINIIAVERISNVILSGAESAKAQNIPNIIFLRTKAELLPRYFPDDSVEAIFLNFSTPLPKKGYTKQRLTHSRFLRIYKNILVDGGLIKQKTDDKNFFEFSLNEFIENGFDILFHTDNLHENGTVGILTEYERKFVSQSLPIYALTAKNKK